ncbi:hypothetical protein [Pedobacter deserti]|uniref:hypothetical protein n=1 Tax=Pedobacter deserti TaxID=2817382 RepID=UPI00210B2069|nr:hypothetical protein [Pedobacter sp. SYSU D00382]
MLVAAGGCSMLGKSTSARSSSERKISSAQERLELSHSRATREHEVFSYWTDSTLYRYENIKDLVNEQTLHQAAASEQRSARLSESVKSRSPAQGLWFWIAGVVVIVVIWRILRLAFRRSRMI